MKQKPIGKGIVLRYVYAMLVIIVIAVTAVTSSLYLIQNDNRVIRDRIGFFHLESALESEKLARDTEVLHDLLVASSTSGQSSSLGAAGVYGAKIGYRGLLHSMRSRIARLSALQDQYHSVTIASTLQRLIDQFERIDSRIRWGGSVRSRTQSLFSFGTNALDEARPVVGSPRRRHRPPAHRSPEPMT